MAGRIEGGAINKRLEEPQSELPEIVAENTLKLVGRTGLQIGLWDKPAESWGAAGQDASQSIPTFPAESQR